jgi:hypothetical protein
MTVVFNYRVLNQWEELAKATDVSETDAKKLITQYESLGENYEAVLLNS